LDLLIGPFHLRRHSIYFLGITILCFLALLMTRILVQPKGHRVIESV